MMDDKRTNWASFGWQVCLALVVFIQCVPHPTFEKTLAPSPSSDRLR